MFGDSSSIGLTLLFLLFSAFLVTPGAFWCYRFCRWIIALALRHPACFRFGAPVLLTHGFYLGVLDRCIATLYGGACPLSLSGYLDSPNYLPAFQRQPRAWLSRYAGASG